ncbi:hypothetical protein MFRU_030g00040 [Monilinia fructicola]|nr:hypothetical protein MFRU_030g00040 [Monilinia fructicola]
MTPLTATTPSTISDFPIFMKLVPEMREAIWKFSLPEMRVIDLIYDKNQDKYLSFRSKVPSLLHTNRESRSFAQRFYQLAFPTKTYPANIWIRFDKDCVYFTDWLAGCNTKTWFEHVNIGPLGKKKGTGIQDLKSIQRVAVNSVYFDIPRQTAPERRWYFLKSITPIQERFHSLKKLYIVVEDINPYQTGEIGFGKIPKHKHLHRQDFCVFCGILRITRAVKRLKWPTEAPVISVVGAQYNKHISHLGRYQKCACNGFIVRPEGTAKSTPLEYIQNCSCEAYVPDPADEHEAEDDLPKRRWGLSENELEDLIADERKAKYVRGQMQPAKQY